MLSTLGIIALPLAAGLAVWLLIRRGRARRLREPLTFERLRTPRYRPDASFVGRIEEQKRFDAILAGWANQADDAVRLLIVTGPPGIGKRGLLHEFRRRCRASPAARLGPVFELAEDTGGPENVMRELAAALDGLAAGSASRFYARLQRLEDQRQGRASPLHGAVQAAQSTAATFERVGAPGGKALSAAWSSGLVEQTVAQLDLPVDVSQLEHALVEDVRGFAARDPAAPLVLMLADLDARPGDPGSAWLRDTLLPRLDGVPVLVVTSVESIALRERLENLLTPSEPLPLEPLTSEEARKYARDVLHLRSDNAVKAVVDHSKGIPKRLEAIREQLEANPGLRRESTLPEWVFTEAGADATRRLLSDTEHPADGRILQAAALLRWFNTALLPEVAVAVGVYPTPTEARSEALQVIERARARSLVKPAQRGWVLADDQEAVSDELRRMAPDVWRDVHVAAAAHHHQRLTGAERPPSLPEMLGWRPPDQLEELLRDPEWLEALVERNHHLLSVRPHEAGRVLCDIAAPMLFLGEDDAARRVLHVEVPSQELGRSRVYVSLLHRAAWALDDERVTDASTSLRELAAYGGPTPLVTAAVRYRLGILHQQLGDEGGAVGNLQVAYDILERAKSPSWRRYLAITAAWLGWLETLSGAPPDAALRRLDDADVIAARLRDPELATSILHFRARILDVLAEWEAARAAYDEVVVAYERLGDPNGIATSRLARAVALHELGDAPSAEEDIGVAESIVQELGDDTELAEVELVRMRLALKGRQLEAAQTHCEHARRLRPNDHDFVDTLGLFFFNAGYARQARRLHDTALAMVRRNGGEQEPEGTDGAEPTVREIPLYYVHLARDLMQLGDGDEAVQALERAAELGPDNPEPLRWLLVLQGDDAAATSGTAERLAGLIVRRVARTQLGSRPSARLANDLLESLDQAAPHLSVERRAEVLTKLITLSPTDPRLQHRLHATLEEDGNFPPEKLLDVLQTAVDCLTDDDPPELRSTYLVDLAERLLRHQRWADAQLALERAAETKRTGPRWAKTALRVQRLARLDRATFAAGDDDRGIPRIRIDISADLSEWFDPGRDGPQAAGARLLFDEMLPDLRAELQRRTGVTLPGVIFRQEAELPARTLRLVVDHVTRATWHVAGDELAELRSEAVLARTGATAIATACAWNGSPASWVDADTAEQLRLQGIATWDPRGVACALLIQEIDDADLAALLDVREVAELFDESNPATPEIQARATVVLRRLIADGIPIADREAVRRVIMSAPPDESAIDVAERARGELIRATVTAWADDAAGSLPTLSLSPPTEALLERARVRRHDRGMVVVLDGRTRTAFATLLREADTGHSRVLAVGSDAGRIALSALVRSERLGIRVATTRELDGIPTQPGPILKIEEPAHA